MSVLFTLDYSYERTLNNYCDVLMKVFFSIIIDNVSFTENATKGGTLNVGFVDEL